MKLAAVYSFHCLSNVLEHNRVFMQALYSITTLRKHSPLPIKVFVSPRSIVKSISDRLAVFNDVEVIYFDNSTQNLDVNYQEGGFAQLLDHRWKNALRTFELFDVDKILYLDADTIFHGDPIALFLKYDNPNTLWARYDVTPHISKKLGIDYGMNDGQFIISREIYQLISPNFYPRQQEMIRDLLASAKSMLTYDEHKLLHWLSVQYVVYKMLLDKRIPVGDMKREDVSLSTEPIFSHKAGCRPSCVLHHYFSGNMHLYVPREFWPKNEAKSLEVRLEDKTPCVCGKLFSTNHNVRAVQRVVR